MHSFEFPDFGPAQDGQTLLLDTCSGVVSLRGWRVDGVVTGAADAVVRARADGVTRGVDSEDWCKDWLLGFMVVCEDEVPNL